MHVSQGPDAVVPAKHDRTPTDRIAVLQLEGGDRGVGSEHLQAQTLGDERVRAR